MCTTDKHDLPLNSNSTQNPFYLPNTQRQITTAHGMNMREVTKLESVKHILNLAYRIQTT